MHNMGVGTRNSMFPVPNKKNDVAKGDGRNEVDKWTVETATLRAKYFIPFMNSRAATKMLRVYFTFWFIISL
jgi:hypothetical protein